MIWLDNASEGNPMPDPYDLAKTYYNAARAEIVQRLVLREQVLLAGVTAFGVIGGLALNGKAISLLGLFPALSALFTVLLFRHHWLINGLAHHINFELSQFLGIEEVKGSNAPKMPIHWDAVNRSSPGKLRLILFVESITAMFLLLGPGVWEWVSVIGIVSWTVFWRDAGLLLFALSLFLFDLHRLIFRWTQ
jgi:hypothetical protein